MATSPKKLFEPSELTTSLATIYPLSEAATSVIDSMVLRLVNITSSAVSVDGNAVPSGGSAGNTNVFLAAAGIPAYDYALVTVPTLKNGDFIQLKASAANSIVIHHESGFPKTP